MMKQLMTRRVLALALALALPAPVLALDAPKYSEADHRVRYADYNAADVIQLDAVIGTATHIVLEPSERYVYHVFGDSEAYAFTYKDNHLFFKPTAEDADTNLLVVTNRRDYAFRISYNADRSASALYKLVMRYPQAEAERSAQIEAAAAIERSLQDVGTPVNWKAYTKSGDASIAPVHAWDDGRQTWMRFAPEADIPAVYRVTPDGQEVITNYHMADSRTMVLHRTSAKWHVRLGDLATAIHNSAYGQVPVPTHTGTASPAVERIVQGVAPQVLPPAPAPEPVATPAQVLTPAPAQPLAVASPTAQTPAPAIKPVKPVEASATGDMILMPARMWEQAGQTWMQFVGPPPRIETLDAQGRTHAVPATTHPNNTVALDGIAQRWQLSDGATSLTISKRDAQ